MSRLSTYLLTKNTRTKDKVQNTNVTTTQLHYCPSDCCWCWSVMNVTTYYDLLRLYSTAIQDCTAPSANIYGVCRRVVFYWSTHPLIIFD